MKSNIPIKVTKYNNEGELIKVYESYAEAGRDNGFFPASLGYAFKKSKIKHVCQYKGFTWISENAIKLPDTTTEAKEEEWNYVTLAIIAVAFAISIAVVIIQS